MIKLYGMLIKFKPLEMAQIRKAKQCNENEFLLKCMLSKTIANDVKSYLKCFRRAEKIKKKS